jgi:hypothetical protein
MSNLIVLFSIIIQTIQLFDHFHKKLHEVLSSSKLESCLRVQNLGAQPRTQYFQGSSRQQLEKCLVYSIFYVFHLGTSLGKGAFPQTGTRMKCIGFYAKFNVEVYHHHAATCLPVCMSLQRPLTTCLFVFMAQGCARNVMP